MEDENKPLKIIRIIIIIIIILIIGALGFFITNKILENTNTTNFTNYLKQNGYKKDELGNYTKQIIDGTTITDYMFYKKDFILSKSISETSEKNTNYTTFTYNNNDTIDIVYNVQGINNSGTYSSGIQKATYNIKTNDFSCNIVLENDFDIKCNNLKKEASKFKKEVEDILKQSNSNAKYIE